MKRPTKIEIEEISTGSTQKQLSGEIPVIRWSTRRKMAWRAFIVLIVCTMIYWFALPLWFYYFSLPTTWLTIIGDSYFWFATAMAAVIMSYMGITTFPFWDRNRNQVEKETPAAEQEEYYK